MGTPQSVERWIVVGTDGSERSLDAVDWAALEAAERGLSLRICHVLPPARKGTPSTRQGGPDRPVEGVEEVAAQAGQDGRAAHSRAVLTAAADRAGRLATGTRIEQTSLSGHPAEALVDAGSGAEALVLGSRGGGGFAALLLGAVSEQVAAHGRCPVLVVRGRRRGGPIAVGVDGSPRSQAALGFAFARAADLNVPVRAVHAYTLSMAVPSFGFVPDIGVKQITEGIEQMLTEALRPWRERFPTVRVTTRIVEDVPSAALVAESRDCGLLVVGSRGHGGFVGLLLGSVSRHALRHAVCPVAVVRS